jgi:hypothetical protein
LQLHFHPTINNGGRKPMTNIFPFINNIKQCSTWERHFKGYPTFSGFMNSKALLRMLSGVSGSRKFKMAAA